MYYYENLKENCISSKKITRFKLIESPEKNRKFSNKNNYLIAIRIFNSLPNQLKILAKSSRKKKLKEWMLSYIYTEICLDYTLKQGRKNCM